MRLIDADALKEKKVYSLDRHEKIVPVAEIDWMPTIDVVPVFVSWLREIAINNTDANKAVTFLEAVEDICNRAETGLRQYLEDLTCL